MINAIRKFIAGMGIAKPARQRYLVTEDEECVTPDGLSCSAHISKLNQLQSSFKQNYNPDHHTIVCSATGSGKTVVAYIAGSAFLNAGERVVMLAPTRELTSELHMKMAGVFGANWVGRYTGGDKNDKDIEHKFVIVATPEAYLSAFRSQRDWALTAKLMIADEAHNIIDPGRGGNLDVAMAVFREKGGKLLLMSGTFPNAEELGEMLDADMFISDVIVTKLVKELIQVPDDIDAQMAPRKLPKDIKPTTTGFVYNRQATRIRKLGELLESFGNDSVIIFVPSKAIGYCLSEHFNIPFHCADIDENEKTKIIQQFRDGTLRRLFATSTLAQGVNTPADRVIICGTSSSKYGHFIGSTTIGQMLGRAGRNKAEAHVYIMGNELELFHAQKEMYGKTLALPTECMLMTKLSNRQATKGDLAASLSLTYAATLIRKAKINEAVDRCLKYLTACDLIKATQARLTLTQEGALLARYFIDPSTYMGYVKLARRLSHIPDSALSGEYKGCLLIAHVIDKLPKHQPPKRYEKDLTMVISANDLNADFKDIRVPKVATLLDYCRTPSTVPSFFGATLKSSVDRWIGMLSDMEKYRVHNEAPGKAIMEPILKTLHNASTTARYKAEMKREKSNVVKQAEKILAQERLNLN